MQPQLVRRAISSSDQPNAICAERANGPQVFQIMLCIKLTSEYKIRIYHRRLKTCIWSSLTCVHVTSGTQESTLSRCAEEMSLEFDTSYLGTSVSSGSVSPAAIWRNIVFNTACFSALSCYNVHHSHNRIELTYAIPLHSNITNVSW